ncbi:MAG: beta-ketoacyl-ACP synthase II [Spirochaetes bacterium]|nr:beta-ketoacyl-ACP synthase II [Spirochaetota bacterium]
MSRRVVITGMGAITPIGNSIPEMWESVKAGKSGAGPITKFDPSEFATKIAAEVKDFDAKEYMDKKEARKMEIFSQFTVAASLEAMKDAKLSDGDYDPDRTGVILGVGIGGFETIESSYKSLFEKGPSRVPPMTIPKLIANIGPANVALMTNAHGPVYSIATACSSGTDAIGNSMRWIREGLGDVVITGGVEACITQLGVAGFNVIQALTTRNDDPEHASRPFDKDRDGFLIGEGAGTLILEELEHAKKRGAPIYAEVVGSGITNDAYHRTAPHPEGTGAITAVRMALNDAGIKPEDVDYINAHGTSTPLNDPTETKVIKEVFGDHAYKLKVSSTKSMHGHLIGAAGAVEAIISALAIRDQYFPATINLEEADPECDLDYVPNTGVEGPINVAVSNSLGFGGHNGIAVLKKYEG